MKFRIILNDRNLPSSLHTSIGNSNPPLTCHNYMQVLVKVNAHNISMYRWMSGQRRERMIGGGLQWKVHFQERVNYLVSYTKSCRINFLEDFSITYQKKNKNKKSGSMTKRPPPSPWGIAVRPLKGVEEKKTSDQRIIIKPFWFFYLISK